MTTHDDKFLIHPGYPVGHQPIARYWDEFIEALEEFGLEKRTTPSGRWSQILCPRTTLHSSRHLGRPFNIITVELTDIGGGRFGPYQERRRYFKTKCPTCGRAMVAGLDECFYCERHRRQRKGAERSRRYRYRHGIVLEPSFKSCPVCGKEFLPKRSTARFCSTTCWVTAHRFDHWR